MAKKLAEAFVVVKVDNKLKAGLSAIRNQTNRAIKGIASNMTRLLGGVFSSLLRNIKRAILGITAAIGAIGFSSIKLASDVGESENLFEVSMGNMAKSARNFSENMASSLGLFAPDVRKMIGTFNVMLKSMGLAEDQSYKMSAGLTQLAQDMASFFNLAPDVAFEKLQAGISGEAEPLKRLGILINETSTKMFAFKNRIGSIVEVNGKLKGELTETEKILARYGLIMERTKTAQGDLANTRDSPANTKRRLGAVLANLRLAIGNLFTGDVADLFDNLSVSIESNKERIVGWIEDMRFAVAGWIEDQGGISGIWEKILVAIGNVKKFITDELIPVFSTLWNITKEIAAQVSNISSQGVTTAAMVSQATGKSGEMALAGGGRKVSQSVFGKDPGQLNEKQISILQAMLEEIRTQTRQQKMQTVGY